MQDETPAGSPAAPDPGLQPPADPTAPPAPAPEPVSPQEAAPQPPAEGTVLPPASTSIESQPAAPSDAPTAPAPEAAPAPEPSPAPETPSPQPAPPVTVNNQTRRSDDDGLEGGWVVVVDGPHKGLRGAFTAVATYDVESGYPATILVRNRDLASEQGTVVVDYGHVRPAWDYHGGR